MKRKYVFLLCTVRFEETQNVFSYQIVDSSMYLRQSVNHAGIHRGDKTVIAFCDGIHGDDHLKKSELREMALVYLNRTGVQHNIDLR